jgi:maleylpyruvate isomerase
VRPQLEIDGARAAHAVLLEQLRSLSDADVPRPSHLPDWTVGHVVTHLARNADSHTGMFLVAEGGGVGDQYPGGMAQRAADIDAGAARPASELLDDLRRSIERLETAWEETGPTAWAHGRGRTGNAGEQSLPDLVFRRWRETEVHHADLGLAYAWTDWSEAYVDLELDRTIAGLAPRMGENRALRLEIEGVVGAWVIESAVAERVIVRAPKRELLAWLLGRHVRPDWPTLAPW